MTTIRNVLICDIDKTAIILDKTGSLIISPALIKKFGNGQVDSVWLCTHRFAEIHENFLRTYIEENYRHLSLTHSPAKAAMLALRFLTEQISIDLMEALGLDYSRFCGVVTPGDKGLGIGETFKRHMREIELQIKHELQNNIASFYKKHLQQPSYSKAMEAALAKGIADPQHYFHFDKNAMLTDLIAHHDRMHPFEGFTHYYYADDSKHICDSALSISKLNVYHHKQEGLNYQLTPLFNEQKLIEEHEILKRFKKFDDESLGEDSEFKPSLPSPSIASKSSVDTVSGAAQSVTQLECSAIRLSEVTGASTAVTTPGIEMKHTPRLFSAAPSLARSAIAARQQSSTSVLNYLKKLFR